MKVYCKRTFLSGEYEREFIEGNWYELDPKEDFENGGSSVFVLMNNEIDENGFKMGLRFTLLKERQGRCEPFHIWFDNVKRVRKMKLERLEW